MADSLAAPQCHKSHVRKFLPSRAAASPVVAALLPIIVVVFIAYLVIGIALPVLPLHVYEGLGLGTFVVGLVAGAQ